MTSEEQQHEALERKIGEMEEKVSELLEVEEALKSSEEKFRNLFQRSNDAIFIHDPDGTIIDVNQKALKLFQHTESEFKAAKIHMLHPEDAVEIEAVIVEALNITERKQAEVALAESEDRYRSLFNNRHTVMLIIDPETGDILDANPAAVSYYGWPHEEITRKKFRTSTFSRKTKFKPRWKMPKESFAGSFDSGISWPAGRNGMSRFTAAQLTYKADSSCFRSSTM